MEADENFPEEEDNPLCLLHCKTPTGAKALTHRDYLGSLLSLGIEREVIGDILVGENGADIIILKTIADYLLANYEKAGHTPLKCEILPIEKLVPPEQKTVTVRESVASVRLDSIISAVFGFSRTTACEHIAKGLVFVNDTQTEKPDAKLNIGDKIVVRGFGKAYFKEIGNLNADEALQNPVARAQIDKMGISRRYPDEHAVFHLLNFEIAFANFVLFAFVYDYSRVRTHIDGVPSFIGNH